ncbi:MAG TPA: hypothetical protein VMG37_15805 [Solirubrobacteraceae bacterium]|nr:hypothetical protein [Solirubrobacteraceae bacterium]
MSHRTVTSRVVSAAACCTVVLSLLVLAPTRAAEGSAPPRLLINTGRSFEVRPASIVLGMVAITGPRVGTAAFRAGDYGHIRWLGWGSVASGRGEAWTPNASLHGMGPADPIRR